MALRSSRERFVAGKQLCSWTGEGGGQNSKGRECLARSSSELYHPFFGGGCYVSSMADFGSNISRCARGGDLSIVCMYCTYIVSIFSSFFLLAKTNRMTTEKKKPKNKSQFQFRTKGQKSLSPRNHKEVIYRKNAIKPKRNSPDAPGEGLRRKR